MNISSVIILSDEIYTALVNLIPQLSALTLPTRDEIQDLITSDATNLLIARAPSGEIVATLTLTCYRVPTGLRALIEDVVVDVSYRGQGIGKKIMDEALRLAKEYGASGVMLTSNPRRVSANHLYQKMGFKRWETNLYFYEF